MMDQINAVSRPSLVDELIKRRTRVSGAGGIRGPEVKMMPLIKSKSFGPRIPMGLPSIKPDLKKTFGL